MIFLYLFLTIVFLSFSQFLLILTIRKPDRISRFFKLSHESKTPLVTFSLLSIIYFFLLLFLLKQLSTPQPDAQLVPFAKYLTTNQSPKADYRQLEHIENQNTEIFYYLYLSPDVSLDSVEKTAKYVRIFCRKKCTINFYDNIHAYLLDRERSDLSLISTQEMEKWNKENYVFVAEHFLGYLPSDSNSFVFEPNKDKYYYSLIK